MHRWLPAIISSALVVAVLAMATTNALEQDEQSPSSEAPVDTPITLCPPDYCAPEPDPPHPTSACPPDWCEPDPGPKPGIDHPLETPNLIASINGIEIPLPEGGRSGGLGNRDPGGAFYIYGKGSSFVSFDTNGWILSVYLAPGEELFSDDFQPTLDALFTAADPVKVGGKSFRVPWGASYDKMYLEAPLDHQGPWPHLNVITRGESNLTFDEDGKIVEERIEAEDADDFRPVTDALNK